MYFDKREFMREIRNYFKDWYKEILKGFFSPADTILGKVRLVLSPMLALLWVIGISFTFTLIWGILIMPFFTLHCVKIY